MGLCFSAACCVIRGRLIGVVVPLYLVQCLAASITARNRHLPVAADARHRRGRIGRHLLRYRVGAIIEVPLPLRSLP